MNKLMRDAFINVIYEKAKIDKKIFFLTADFGAEALDDFRVELPNQCLHMGISEQNMVDFGAGLAIRKNQVVLYAMAPFLIPRAYEQIKSVVSAMNLPIIFLSVGSGLGYDHATATHFTLEDIALAKAINHMQVWTISDSTLAEKVANYVLNNKNLVYVRLERNKLPILHENITDRDLEFGYKVIKNPVAENKSICILTYGYLSHIVNDLVNEMNYNIKVIDIFRIKPLHNNLLNEMHGFENIITVEEQILEGGFGSGIIEFLVDNTASGLNSKIHRMGVKDKFDVTNGNRHDLQEKYGISREFIVSKINSIKSEK
jgi:transketolase